MDDDIIREQALIDRYVMGQLDDAEAERFELYFLDRPDLAEEVAAARRLLEGLKATGTAVEIGRADPAQTPSPGGLPWLPMAASVLLGIGVGAIGSDLLDRGTEEPIAALQVTSAYDFVQTRSSGTEPRVFPPAPSSGLTLLSVEAGPAGQRRYDVSLSRASGSGVVELPDATADEDGFLRFALETTRLGEGHYVLELRPRDGGQTLSFPFAIAER